MAVQVVILIMWMGLIISAMSKKGFTLVEILMIVTVLAVMSSVVLPRFFYSNQNINSKQELSLLELACNNAFATNGNIVLFDDYKVFSVDVTLDDKYNGWAVNLDQDEVFTAVSLDDQKNVYSDNERVLPQDFDFSLSGIDDSNSRMLLFLSAENGVLDVFYANNVSLLQVPFQDNVTINVRFKNVKYGEIGINKYTLKVTKVLI